MSDAVLKELWLHCLCGFEPEAVDKVLGSFKSPENVFGTTIQDESALEGYKLPKKFVRGIVNKRYMKEAQNILEYCDRKGIRIITTESDEYPECLKNVYLPPRILFALGKRLRINEGVAVSVVGCRKPTPEGRNIAEKIGRNLAESGIIVVSGMAEGIDAAAHNGALMGNGLTVAVLAGGVDDIYPRSNKGLYYRILESGTVISERPPQMSGRGFFYQQRNRIIAGLCMGAVIVEGEIKGGTAITARQALENNRDVFAVPGSPTEPNSALPNSIIKDGAMIIDNISAVSEYYRERYPETVKAPPDGESFAESTAKTVKLSEEDLKIVEALRANGNIAVADVIAMHSNIPIHKLSARLTILCVKGVIKQESGNRFLLIMKDKC